MGLPDMIVVLKKRRGGAWQCQDYAFPVFSLRLIGPAYPSLTKSRASKMTFFCNS